MNKDAPVTKVSTIIKIMKLTVKIKCLLLCMGFGVSGKSIGGGSGLVASCSMHKVFQ